MHTLRKAALLLSVIAIAALTSGVCFAEYQFDDLEGPSGISTQWMVLNDSAGTFGAAYDTPIRISADLLSTGTATLNVQTGTSATDITDRNLQTLFLVLSEGSGEFDMSMRSQTLSFDVSTPNLGMSTRYSENQTPYIDTKDSDPSKETSSEWKNYHFKVARQNDRNKYDTVIQSFYFQQNPGSAPSQGIPRPMVISNVYSGTAADGQAPLVVRMSLRDSYGALGNIVAYDRATWTMNESKTVGNNQWVFVPVDDLNTDNKRIDYYLTTEVANNTSYRYAARYPDSTGDTVVPREWKFDIFRPQGTTDIPSSFLLAADSDIAPGLVTVYSRNYNINEQNKAPLHLFPHDTPNVGDYDLRLNHKILFGKRLGETYTYSASEGRFNLIEATAFNFLPASTSFLSTVASLTNSAGTVAMPTTSIFSSSSVTRTPIASDVLEYFTLNQSIPSGVRGSGSEGLFPLHITFNIPVTRNVDSVWWNDMLKAWRDTGRIEDTFSDKYELFLRAGDDNVWNLTQELKDKGYYNELVKVYLDEERGRLTQDNYSGVLTISFIVMLMDGTRDGVRPELSIVPDNSVAQQNNYIVIRDGVTDNRWNMTFFVAPKGWQDNPTTSQPGTGTGTQGVGGGSGSGGGGCSAFGIAGLLAMSFFVIRTRRD